MHLVRSWLGQALRATGAAVVVPVAILLALSLTSIGGAGLGGLGSLGQIVSGPDVAGRAAVDDGGGDIAAVAGRLAGVQALSLSGGQGAPGTGGVGGGAPGGGQTPAGGGLDGTGGGGGGPGGGGVDETGGGGGNGGGNGNGGSPPPPEAPPPSPRGVVETVGDAVEEVTRDTPVAPTVEQLVDELVETCGRLNCP